MLATGRLVAPLAPALWTSKLLRALVHELVERARARQVALRRGQRQAVSASRNGAAYKPQGGAGRLASQVVHLPLLIVLDGPVIAVVVVVVAF